MAGLFDPKNSLTPGLGMLGGLGAATQNTFLGGLGTPSPIKRRAFFSFHFDDVMRVNNVRQSWRYYNSGSALVPSFTDSSLWESKQLEGDDALKRLIREGVEYTSAVCVLAGSETWLRRWVKYEIARAVIDNRGLLTVHINGLNHHNRRVPDLNGPNPLDFLAVGQDNCGAFHLYEKRAVLLNPLFQQYGWEWHRYSDHTQSVSLPAYLPKPAPGYVMPLSAGAPEYFFATQDGSKNIGVWIDRAAQMVGR